MKISQTNAILSYIARKNGMEGKTETEKQRIDLMAAQAMDFINGFSRLCYNKEFVRRQ